MITAAVLLTTTPVVDDAQAASICRECIHRVVRKKHRAMQRCYNKLLTRSGPGPQGKVHVRFAIETTGKTSHVVIRRNDLKDKRFGSCIAGVFESMQFEKPRDQIRVTYPLVFKPSD